MTSIFDFPPGSLPVRLLERLERWSLRVADVGLTVNLACKKLFVSRSCAADKMRVVMNSPDEKIFAFQRPRPDASTPRAADAPFVIMYHGSIVERNGLDVAVDALARLRRRVPGAVLRIYGATTPFLEAVMDAARASGVQEAIDYRGPKRAEDIAAAIDACDVGVIPNRRSIFTELNTPTRIFEYLSLGKPVIAPRAPGIQDYLDEDSIVFFELGDAEDLARQLEHVFFHPRETLETVARGQDVYLAHTWRQERQRLVDLTAGLLTGERRLAETPGVTAWAPPD
jgi:glycosyltransferase involved in cell wall biosynthesis